MDVDVNLASSINLIEQNDAEAIFFRYCCSGEF